MGGDGGVEGVEGTFCNVSLPDRKCRKLGIIMLRTPLPSVLAGVLVDVMILW